MTPTQLGEIIFDFISRLEDAEAESWDDQSFIEGMIHLTIPFTEGRWAIIVTRPAETDTIQ